MTSRHGDLLSSQSNFDHVTRLKFRILLCVEAGPALLFLSNNEDFRFAASSAHSWDFTNPVN
jgi:hypothetical protein